jgi:crotonobetainyl-CoA:carnitine CoA-transferase CaiB-like acyl-CoA transferase
MNPSLPLEGIRVIEFCHIVMGPTCGLILGDLGAEVIKVEPLPEGDRTRKLTGSGAGYWPMFFRNKKSLALDLSQPAAMQIVLRLIGTADVVTENFKPGAMKKLGLDYATLKGLNPRLVYCTHKGFLPGPYDHRPALDEVVQMMGGLAYMTGLPGRPLRAGTAVNDIMGGMFGAIGVLAALRERDRTGKGQEVAASLFENNIFLVGQHMAQYEVTGKPAGPMAVRVAAWAVYDIFTTCDDEQVFVGVVTDTQWKQFCAAFGLTELAADPALATNPQRVHARERLMPIVTALFKALTKRELMDRCEKHGLPYAPITRPDELLEDPHLVESNGFTDVTLADGRPCKVPRLPLEMDGRRFGTRLDLPKVGEHTRELLEGLGYGTAEIDALLARGVALGG